MARRRPDIHCRRSSRFLLRALPWTASLLLLAVVSTSSCNRLSPDRAPIFLAGPATIGDAGVGVSSQVQIDHPLFAGLAELVAGDAIIDLRWEAAEDDEDSSADIRYRIYVAQQSDGQPFPSPLIETGAGATAALLTGLPNGVTVFVVVRAVDTEGNEDSNTVEWFGTPNPVRFVRGGGGGGAPDGLTPGTAFATVGQAVAAGLPLAGVNFHVAGGAYLENVFLFPGMALYGAFATSFSFAERDFVSNPTEFSSPFPVDLVTMVPGVLPIVIDGCVMSGNAVNETGVKVEDVRFQITNCEIRDMVIHGVEILSDVAEGDPVSGVLRGCSIIRSGGEGVTIVALGDIVIDDNLVTDNANEGIESQWLFAEAGETTRIEVTRNRIARNGGEGVDLDFAELSEIDSSLSQGGRIRVLIRANDIRGNQDFGVQLDLDFENSDGIDFEARVEDNQISNNRGGGVLFDGDAGGSFRMARNVITANAVAGITIQGTPDGPWCRLLNSRVLGNDGPGVTIRDHVGLEIRNCAFGHNSSRAVQSPRSSVEVVNCIFVANGGTSDIAVLRDSTVFAEPVPVLAGLGVSTVDPLLENWPIAVRYSVSAGSSSEAILADTAVFAVGDTIELRDDGVRRTVESILVDRIAFAPPLNSGTVAGEPVFVFGSSTSVAEREGFLDGSPAIDGGDALESDRDGSVVDQGPIGGDTPGNVGIETGLASETVPNELEYALPVPSLLISSATATVQFRRPVDAAFEASVSLTIAGVPTGVTFGPAGPLQYEFVTFGAPTDEFTFSATGPAPVGQRFGVDLAPVPGSTPDADDRQPHHITFAYLLADTAVDIDPPGGDLNGSVGTAQLVALPVILTGTIGQLGDSDYYRMALQAGAVLHVDLIANRRESPLGARLSVLSGDGTVTFLNAEANPPFTRDPVLDPFVVPADGEYVVRVSSVDGSGSPAAIYELQLSVR